ncbi:MAG: hypothetical protein LBO03_09305 [Acidaminococcales bacterium]|nr:hypothetical protein [Acidaminococcales bacterium]
MDRQCSGTSRQYWRDFLQGPLCRCVICEKDIYDGDRVLRDNRFRAARAYICMDCYETLKNEGDEVALFLGATFEEAF